MFGSLTEYNNTHAFGPVYCLKETHSSTMTCSDEFYDCLINNWDCGYYQLKMLWKEYMPKELAKFRALYSKLADKMRPMMYELGLVLNDNKKSTSVRIVLSFFVVLCNAFLCR